MPFQGPCLLQRNFLRVCLPLALFTYLIIIVYLHTEPSSGRFFQSRLCQLSPDYSSKHTHCQAPADVPVRPFPRRIWQTYKQGAAALDDGDRAAIRSWEEKNPGWRYELFTDETARVYVEEKFGDMPEVRDGFLNISDPILRADIFRYMVLYQEGGVYSDVDTQALKPVDEWVPKEYRDKANVVLGVEYDRLDGQRWADWTLGLQLCNWVMLSKPGHRLWKWTIEGAIRSLKELAGKQNETLASVHPDYLQVLDSTGPAAMTRNAFKIFSDGATSKVTWRNLTRLEEPRLLGDILVLPVTAFAPGQVHSNSKPADDPQALVNHLWKGSWKSNHKLHIDLSKG